MPVPVLLLTLAAFLCPLIGGQIPNDTLSLEPGYVPTVQSLFRGSELATLQHALLALLVVAAFSYLVLRRKIVQVPHAWINGPLVAFLVLLLGSVFMSEYRWVSLTSVAEWAIYGLGLITAVAGLGRKNGPLAVLCGLAAGTGLTALIGILEYAQVRSTDPTWRIFAGWNNPNAVAGMLGIGLLVSLGILAYAIRRKSEGGGIAWMQVLGAIGGVLCGLALLLTGSKGGVLSSALGLATLAGLLVVWRKGFGLVQVAACVMLSVALFWAIQRGGGAATSRLVSTGATQEQSSGFRLQLWKGAATLVRENPLGHGMATYAFYSAKPGTNTRTELAHETWLELAVEAGFLAPLALILMLLAWIVHAFRSAKALPSDQNVLRAAVIAAVVAAAANGFVESNLYYFGAGLAFFLLLGVGIQISADGGSPEFAAAPMRASAVLFSVLCLVQLIFAGYVSKLQANIRWLAQPPNATLDEARATEATLRSIAPFDGETWYWSGFFASNLDEAIRFFGKAAEVAPSPKYLRRLASVLIQANRPAEAETALHHALELDPNNLLALTQLMELEDKLGKTDEAKAAARELVDVEKTPYFRIRALPEIVPTETYEARIFLAKTEPNKIELLRGAVEGLLQFVRVTVPYAHAIEKAGSSVNGLSLQDAKKEIQLGVDTAKQLEELYRRSGEKSGAEWAHNAVSEFERALGAQSE